MKALLLRQYGSPDSLELGDIETPVPKKDQVLIKIHAVSINDWDWGLILGAPFVPNRLMAGLLRPKIIVGSDIAGRVEAVGSSVTRFKPGDDVYGDLSGCGFGGFAEFVCVSESELMVKSSRMSFQQAAAIPQAGMLAFQGVNAGGSLKPGQSILINGAGGGVGSIAIQLLKPHQVEVTGVDSEAKFEAMQSWGYDHVIDYRAEDFTRTGKQYDLIVDTKTDKSPADYERALNPNGVYATVGGQLLRLLQVACARFRFKRARDKTLCVVALKANRDLDYFNALIEAGKFTPVIDTEYAFKEIEIRKAFHHFAAAAHKGKIVIRM